METRTYTMTLEVEVKITSYGSPGTGPNFHGPGDPPEGPEFEIETITIDGNAETVEALYKKHKEKLGPFAVSPGYDQFFADLVYDKILDKANEDTWDPADGDYEERSYYDD